ncbi:MAG: hypothetical protein KC502_05790 [Myxococcales bacterium]|nr:hypothetical protein [Myxococcales bacterium]
MAATIATTGLFATLNMSTSVIRGNTDLRYSSEAQLLAEHLIASVQMQGMLWVDAVPYGAAEELKRVPPNIGDSTAWQMYNHGSGGFSKDNRVGRLGNDTLWDNGAQLLIIDGLSGWGQKHFCAHYRVTRVSDDLARIEIRVSWARPPTPVDATAKCVVAMVTDANADKMYSSVSLAATVMRNLNANEIVAPSF